MWLASVSRRGRDDRIIATTRYTPAMRAQARKYLWAHVRGVGDHERFRLFRMQVTTCLHVAVNDDDLAKLPASWCEWPGTALAGGPVEVLEEKGIPDMPSTKPCHNPKREPIPHNEYDPGELWLPIDCGRCPPCRARLEIERGEACKVATPPAASSPR